MTRNEEGFGWAEPEMAYEEAETLTAPDAAPGLWTPDQGPAPKLADLKKTMNVMAGRPPSPSAVKLATAGGAKLEMVMSRALRAMVEQGLALGFAKTLRLSVPLHALRHDPHWYVPSVMS